MTKKFKASSLLLIALAVALVFSAVFVACDKLDKDSALTFVAAKEATCLEAGNIAHYVDKDGNLFGDGDGKIPLTDEQVFTTPALGHNWGDWVYNEDATCKADGTETRVCARCQANETQTALGSAEPHKYTTFHPLSGATCTEPAWEYALCDYCGDARYERPVGQALGHSFGNDTNYHRISEPDCTHNERVQATCLRCVIATDTREVPGTALGHNWVDNKCTRKGCGADRTAALETIKYNKDAGTLTFGQYPQALVDNDTLKAALAAKAGAAPTKEAAGNWTSFGYYHGGEGIYEILQDDYQWYIDVEHEGKKYRGIYFASYRGNYTECDSADFKNPSDDVVWGDPGDNWSLQDEAGYDLNTMYWFEYQPIVWRVLEIKDGRTLVMSQLILDSQQFYHDIFADPRMYHSDVEQRDIRVRSNNYEASDIRAWLNSTFYNSAFGDTEQQVIATLMVDNSKNVAECIGGDNDFCCNNTFDNVFLLSYADVTNPAYFSDCEADAKLSWRLGKTDYAMSQNLSYKYGFEWWLRTPYYDVDDYNAGFPLVNSVYLNTHYYDLNKTGGALGQVSDSLAYDTTTGVVPALWLDIDVNDTLPAPETYTEGLIFNKIAGKDEYSVSFPKSKVGIFEEIRVPATYHEVPVTEIGKFTLNAGSEGMSSILRTVTNFYFPSSITHVIAEAFGGNKILNVYYDGDLVQWAQIDFAAGESATSCPFIGADGNATLYCKGTKVTSISLDVADLKEISARAFMDLDGLTSINIGAIDKIGDSAFQDANCQSVSINAKVIGDSAFEQLGHWIDTSGTYQTAKYSAITLTIGNNVQTIGADAFNTAKGIQSALVLGDHVQTIGASAFYLCTSITSITIPDSVQTIGDNAFYTTSSVSEIHLGIGVQSIGSDAFNYCGGGSTVQLYYAGNQDQFDGITKDPKWLGNYSPMNYNLICQG